MTTQSVKQFFKSNFKKLLVLIILIVLLLHNWAGGSFGLRPATHGCIGILVSYTTVNKFFPKGEVRLPISFFSFRYFAPSETFIKNNIGYGITNKTRFCLGQDVWFGE